MKQFPNLSYKIMDKLGIGILILLVGIAIAFRAAPITFVNPGFPILNARDWEISQWKAYPPFLPPNEYPDRLTDIQDFYQVSYESRFSLEDTNQAIPTSFSIRHIVTRYGNNEIAEEIAWSNYQNYAANVHSGTQLITDISDFEFLSASNNYRLWCEITSRDPEPVFIAESVDTCYYYAVYGSYYSELRVSMLPIRGGGRLFSLVIFKDVINRADTKLFQAIRK